MLLSQFIDYDWPRSYCATWQGLKEWLPGDSALALFSVCSFDSSLTQRTARHPAPPFAVCSSPSHQVSLISHNLSHNTGVRQSMAVF